MVFGSITNKLTSSGGAQQDELITENAETIAGLQEDVGDLQAALDGGPVETSGSEVHLAADDVEDIAQEIRERPQATAFRLEEDGSYPLRSELDCTGPDGRRELEVYAPGSGAEIVVASEDVDHFAWLGNTSGGAFDRLSLRNLSLVVDPRKGYDAGWGRFWIDDRVDNRDLSIEGRRDYYDGDGGDKFGYHCCITTPSGTGVHRNIDLSDGDTPGGGQFDHAIGIGAGAAHVGTNYWLGCSAEEWRDNGIYVKDGVGSNVLIGCSAHNCGGTGIRIGENDVAIACDADWDLPRDPKSFGDYHRDSDRYPDNHDEYDGLHARAVPNGICFGADAASATSMVGLDVTKETGTNEAVRIWTDDTDGTDSDQITLQDVSITNETDQWALAFRGTGSATAKGDNLHIVDTGGSAVTGAAVQVDRWNVVLEDSVIDVSGGSGDRDAIDHQSGRVDIVRGSLAGAAGHCIRVQDGAGRLLIDGTQLLGGIYCYPDSSVGALQLLDADVRQVETMWPAADPRDVCSELRIRDPIGDVDEYPRRASSGNSGNGGVSAREVSWIEAEGQRTPVYDIPGDADGPTVAIVGGVHGDEDPGFRVAGRLASMHPQRGTLRVIPRANPEAIADRARNAGYDLNRQFDRDDGPQTELAQALWDAVRDADIVVDLHRSIDIYPEGNGQAVFSSEPGRREGQRLCPVQCPLRRS